MDSAHSFALLIILISSIFFMQLLLTSSQNQTKWKYFHSGPHSTKCYCVKMWRWKVLKARFGFSSFFRSINHSYIFYFLYATIYWHRHKIKQNGNISIVAPIQLSVIVWKCDAGRFSWIILPSIIHSYIF